MTRWGLLLLTAYLALGLSPLDTRRTVRYSLVLTAVVIAFVGFRASSP